MTPGRRVKLAEAAQLLNLKPGTVTAYARDGKLNTQGVRFPESEGDEWDSAAAEWLADDLEAWQKGRTGRGQACDECGNVVKHRKKDPVTGLRLCKSCDLLAGEREVAELVEEEARAERARKARKARLARKARKDNQ